MRCRERRGQNYTAKSKLRKTESDQAIKRKRGTGFLKPFTCSSGSTRGEPALLKTSWGRKRIETEGGERVGEKMRGPLPDRKYSKE